MPIRNLPLQVTSFVGRETDIATVISRLRDTNCHLLTLQGVGGIGKTRLAIASAQQLSEDDFIDGIVFIALASLKNPENIVTEIITTLGILMGDDTTPYEVLLSYLSDRNLLIILDNLEHLLPDAVDLVDDIIRLCPMVTWLITSRERLYLQAEHILQVDGLTHPKDDSETGEGYSALTLFEERAKQIQYNFDLQANYKQVRRICQAVAGLPLAIELATSWLSSLTCDQIIIELEKGIDLLATRNRNIPERHRSIRATFDYSWERLNAKEKVVFSKLSIFRGGFTFEAAEAIADATILTLSSLIEKSMIRMNNNGRYDLHKLLREYASQKLDTVSQDSVWERYKMYYAQFSVDKAIDIKGRRQIEGLNEFQEDFDNIRITWYLAIESSDLDALAMIMECLTLFCKLRTYYRVGLTLFEDAIYKVLPNESKTIHPILNRLRAYYLHVRLLPQKYPVPINVTTMTQMTLHHAEKQEDWLTELLCHWLRGMYLGFDNQLDDALVSMNRAMHLAEDHNTTFYQGCLLGILNNLFTFQYYDSTSYGDDINRKYEAITRQLKDYHGIADALFIKSRRYMRMGRYEEDSYYLEESLTYWRMVGDQKSIAGVLHTKGINAFFEGNFAISIENLQESIELNRILNFHGHGSIGYAMLSMISAMIGQQAQARVYLNSLDSSGGLNGSSVDFFSNMANAVYATIIGEANFAHSLLGMLRNSQHIPMLESMAITMAVFPVFQKQDYYRATQYLGLVFTHPASRKGWMKQWDKLGNLQSDIRNKLGTTTYEQAWQHGKQLDLAEIIEQLQREFYASNESSISSIENANQALIEPLTERELEILGLIANGLSNAGIGEHLYIAEGTVKKHVFNIYQKLDVKRRVQAIERGRNLGLLS